MLKKKRYTIDAFFAGVGGIELGFTQTKKFEVIYANEFDSNAQITYKKNYPNVYLDERDIHLINSDEVPFSDLIVGGFPCQAFSIAGYRKGFEDNRGDLFFELLKMINKKNPKAIFIENVKNLVTHDDGNTFKVIREALVMNGYFIKWKTMNSKDYGNIPQNRERIYVVGFKSKKQYDSFHFPNKINRTTTLNDVIDFKTKQDDKYYYREGKQPFYSILKSSILDSNKVYQWRRQYVRENKSGVVPTLTANMGTGGHNVPLILTENKEIRKLTPQETFNVQGYPKDFELPDIANGQLYKQAGNSVSVPVIKRIAKKISEALDVSDGIEISDDSFIQGSKYALIYSNIRGKFAGASYVKKTADNVSDLMQEAEDEGISLLSEENYRKIIKKDKLATFYMIEKIN